jgi:hypothetical protein
MTMRTLLVAALLGTSALAGPARAQQQPPVTPTEVPAGQAAAQAGIAECDRLIAYLEQARTAPSGVTLEQAREWRRALDGAACHTTIGRLTGEGAAPAQDAPRGPGDPVQTGALPGLNLQNLTVDALEDMSVFNARGEKLGDVDGVLTGADNKTYLVIGQGGFLGVGGKKVALAADQLALAGDQLVAEGLTDDQIRALPEFKASDGFKEMDGSQSAQLRRIR